MMNSPNPNAVAQAVAALTLEMMPGRAKSHPDTDTMFVGGWRTAAANKAALTQFGLDKNYKLILASFAGDPADGPAEYDVFVNDGVDDFAILRNGRLWKRDARSAAVLLFDDIKGMVKLSTKGRPLVREAPGDIHEFGYQLAASAVRARIAQSPVCNAVISTIGTMPVVLEMRAFANTFAMAA